MARARHQMVARQAFDKAPAEFASPLFRCTHCCIRFHSTATVLDDRKEEA